MRKLSPFMALGAIVIAAAAFGQSTIGTPYPSTPVVMASKVQGETAKLSWGAVTSYTDGTAFPAGTVVTYDVYEALPGGTFAAVASGTGLSALTFTTAPLLAGEPCFEIDAEVNGVYSVSSNNGCVKVSLPPPSAPALQTIQ